MAKGYTTEAAVENYLLQDIDSSFSAQITTWIEAIEAEIDRITGRNFVAGGTATERVYDGNGEDEILIDDCVQITKVECDDEEIASADYYLYPANTTRKYKIKRKYGTFTSGTQNVTVTAKWGYSTACPADLALAAAILVAGIVGHSSNPDSKVRSESVGKYSVTYDTDKGWQDFEWAKKVIQSYISYNF